MLLEKIYLSGPALDTISISAIEASHSESRGFLFGYVSQNGIYNCVNSCPILHTDRKPTEVSYSNETALNRVRRFVKLMNDCAERPYKFIAGYHVHPFTKGDDLGILSRLSKQDKEKDELIWGDALSLGQNSWIELVVRLIKSDGTEDKYFSFRHFKKRLGLNLCFGDNLSDSKYSLMFSAFHLTPSQKNDKLIKAKEIKVVTNGYK